MSRLVVSNLSINRAELPVVTSVELIAESGAISVVLGANGAGKTTLLEGLSGIIPVAGGTIAIDGRELQKARPGARSREGLAHVEQGRTVFRQLTTEENLRVSLHPGAAVAEALHCHCPIIMLPHDDFDHVPFMSSFGGFGKTAGFDHAGLAWATKTAGLFPAQHAGAFVGLDGQITDFAEDAIRYFRI